MKLKELEVETESASCRATVKRYCSCLSRYSRSAQSMILTMRKMEPTRPARS